MRVLAWLARLVVLSAVLWAATSIATSTTPAGPTLTTSAPYAYRYDAAVGAVAKGFAVGSPASAIGMGAPASATATILAPEAGTILDEGGGAAARTFQTYTKTNPVTGEVYVGRTSGFGTPAENLLARDASHAYNARGFGPAVLDQTSDSAFAIRGREQQLIDYYRLQGNSANAINGVSPFNRNWVTYMQAAWDAFGAPGG